MTEIHSLKEEVGSAAHDIKSLASFSSKVASQRKHLNLQVDAVTSAAGRIRADSCAAHAGQVNYESSRDGGADHESKKRLP